MKTVLYLDAEEFIRKREFVLNVPAFYHPNMPDELVNPKPPVREKVNRFYPVQTGKRNLAPFRQIVDPMQKQIAHYSVEVMIDMFQKKIEFEMIHDEDVVEILDGIDRYLVMIRPYIEDMIEDITVYAKKMIAFRSEVYKHYFRYMNLNPAALQSLYPNNDPKRNIFTLMSLGVKKERLKLEPLKARAFPPYDLEDCKPKEAAVDDNVIIESSLGISTAALLKDDGKDFDFHHFLQGK